MQTTATRKDDLVLCRSDAGDGGWSLHAPGSTDEAIAEGDAPCLASGPAEWNDGRGDWDRPNAEDYREARSKLPTADGTYTIAYIDSMLIATVPDGEDIAAAVQEYAEYAGEPVIENYQTEEGLTLTDEEPDDRDRIVWNAKGGHGGFLMVETDEGTKTYNYAIR